MDYYLSLGSNIGNRISFLKKALGFLSETGNIKKISPVYETSPFGVIGDQNKYLNMAVTLHSETEPMEMLEKIKNIESKMGRNLIESHLKPRKIDIDILFCDDIIIKTKKLSVPHRKITQRRFVLIPLNDINPELVNPESGVTVKELLISAGTAGTIELYRKQIKIKK